MNTTISTNAGRLAGARSSCPGTRATDRGTKTWPRSLASVLLTFMIGLIGLSGGSRAGDEPKDEKARAAEFLALATQEAGSYSFRRDAGDARLTLRAEPILRWTNPLVGTIHGGVFLWTEGGRPEVVASIYKWHSPHTHRTNEFQSLSQGTFVAERDGRPVWTPARPGVELKPIPDAAAPTGTPAGRLRQMRDIAGEYAGRQTDRQDVDRDLRLLTQPIYRYEGATGDLIDGALFAFVLGTDPEALLLIEARRIDGAPRWQYAVARLSHNHLRVSHRGREVWSVPKMFTSQASDPDAPYILFRFDLEAAATP